MNMETAIGILIMFVTILALEAGHSYLEGKREANKAWERTKRS